MAITAYRLGCPMWGYKEWVGTLYSPRARARDFLAEYATVFNTVEGNTTFYSLPSEPTVARWREQTPETFRFCFKLPRTVTHEKSLRDARAQTDAFFARLAPLGQRLGPFMIQLPASFGPDRVGTLAGFLETLPQSFRYAVELRHLAFYRDESTCTAVNELLAAHRCERVMIDTSAMHAGDRGHPEVAAAEHKKPDLPITPVVTARSPMLRFIGHPDDDVNTRFYQRWAARIASWIGEQRSPYVFIHCPNNLHAPAMARRLHSLIAARAGEAGAMPAWPGELRREPQQLDLL